jgi:hypothetical protein
MFDLQNDKIVNVIPPGAVVDNAAFTSTVVDTAGFDTVAFVVSLGATDAALATLKIQESDTKTDATTLSSGSDVTGLVWGTSTDPDTGTTSALPSATDDNKVFVAYVDTKARKRYLQLQATAGNGTTGTYLNAVAVLGRAGQGAYDAETRGLGSNLIA